MSDLVVNVRTMTPTPAIAALIKSRSLEEQVSGPAVVCAIITAFVDANHDAIGSICNALDNAPATDGEKIYFKLPADIDQKYGRICALMGNRKSDLTAALLILVEAMSSDSVNHRKALNALYNGTKNKRRKTDVN
jgi:hypothetical protein